MAMRPADPSKKAYPKGQGPHSAQYQATIWRSKPVAFVRDVCMGTPDVWQVEALESLAYNKKIALKACKGPGKAITKATVIDTPTGPRKWGSLEVGDFVFAEDGSPTKVLAVYERGVRQTYRMVFDDGSSAQICGQHLWKVRGRTERRHGTWSNLSTEEIVARGVREPNGRWQTRQFEIPQQGPAQFPTAELPMDAYLLGIWIGDGDKTGDGFTAEDSALEWLLPELNLRTHEVALKVDLRSRGVHVGVYGLRVQVRAAGLEGVGSHERYIPNGFKYADVAQRKDMLAGLMDTDGCIGEDNYSEYDTTSRRLADDVVWLVRSLGGVAYIKDGIKKTWYRTEDGDKVHCKDLYRVTVTVPFNPFKCPKKAERWRMPQARYLTRYIDRIEPAGEAEVSCIAVEHPSECFLANDFIVTHNTRFLAWAIWWWLFTRPKSNIVCMSITSDNLKDNLWAELARVQAVSPLLRTYFIQKGERIEAIESPKDWWCSARSFPQNADKTQQANTIAGLHGVYPMVVCDEVGDYPDGVVVAAEGIFANDVDARLLIAGNPTQTEGPLYRVCTRDRYDWWVQEITGDPDDPSRASRISLDWARKMINDWGRDNAWVMVNVFGKFPPQQSNKLLGPDDVAKAMARKLDTRSYEQEPVVLGLDVARFGTNKSVLFKRQGAQVWSPRVWRELDLMTLADQVMYELGLHKPQCIFVDDSGVGGGVVDRLRQLGVPNVIACDGGSAPVDQRFKDRRAEMWHNMAQAIKGGLALPQDLELSAELLAPNFDFILTNKRTTFKLESKADLKRRGVESPDLADALALTYYSKIISPIGYMQQIPMEHRGAAQASGKIRGGTTDDYDPFH